MLLILALLPALPVAGALARSGFGPSCVVAAAVAQHAFMPAPVRIAVVPELALASINKRVLALFN